VETGAVADLVARARQGDDDAWAALVDRYLGTVQAICRGYRLGDDAAADVNQVVWLRLAEHLWHLRAPEVVGGWIAATTRNECLRRMRSVPAAGTGDGDPPGGDGAGGEEGTGFDAGLLVYERDRALLGAFDRLDPRARRLLRLVMAEPRPGDDDIAAALDLPAANIAAARARALDQLRQLMSPERP
jgi:DNA-directed RNA polymerase specialized sigma24 family protein